MKIEISNDCRYRWLIRPPFPDCRIDSLAQVSGKKKKKLYPADIWKLIWRYSQQRLYQPWQLDLKVHCCKLCIFEMCHIHRHKHIQTITNIIPRAYCHSTFHQYGIWDKVKEHSKNKQSNRFLGGHSCWPEKLENSIGSWCANKPTSVCFAPSQTISWMQQKSVCCFFTPLNLVCLQRRQMRWSIASAACSPSNASSTSATRSRLKCVLCWSSRNTVECVLYILQYVYV